MGGGGGGGGVGEKASLWQVSTLYTFYVSHSTLARPAAHGRRPAQHLLANCQGENTRTN